MDSKEFKVVFNEVAKSNDFKKAFGGWYKESAECIAVLELQKSNFGNYYLLNIKIFINGVFGRIYTLSKDLVKSSMGHINEQINAKDFLDFDEPIDDNLRIAHLHDSFRDRILPFTDITLSKAGIRKLADDGILSLLPAVKDELEKLIT